MDGGLVFTFLIFMHDVYLENEWGVFRLKIYISLRSTTGFETGFAIFYIFEVSMDVCTCVVCLCMYGKI